MNNEQIVRRAYEMAEKVNIKGFVDCFTPDGTFTDMSIGVTYRGAEGSTGLGKTVEVYAKAFSDMHRELYIGVLLINRPATPQFCKSWIHSPKERDFLRLLLKTRTAPVSSVSLFNQ